MFWKKRVKPARIFRLGLVLALAGGAAACGSKPGTQTRARAERAETTADSSAGLADSGRPGFPELTDAIQEAKTPERRFWIECLGKLNPADSTVYYYKVTTHTTRGLRDSLYIYGKLSETDSFAVSSTELGAGLPQCGVDTVADFDENGVLDVCFYEFAIYPHSILFLHKPNAKGRLKTETVHESVQLADLPGKYFCSLEYLKTGRFFWSRLLRKSASGAIETVAESVYEEDADNPAYKNLLLLIEGNDTTILAREPKHNLLLTFDVNEAAVFWTEYLKKRE